MLIRVLTLTPTQSYAGIEKSIGFISAARRHLRGHVLDPPFDYSEIAGAAVRPAGPNEKCHLNESMPDVDKPITNISSSFLHFYIFIFLYFYNFIFLYFSFLFCFMLSRIFQGGGDPNRIFLSVGSHLEISIFFSFFKFH